MPHLFAIVLSALLALAPEKPVRAASPLLLTPAEAHELMTSPYRHVRALDPHLDQILSEGLRRSQTLGSLLWALQQTDVIVQIVPSSTLPLSVPGRMMLVPGSGERRFVRIEIRVEGSDEELMVLLGHELQHALEVANAPEVRDPQGMLALYRRIGHGGAGENDFDTDAAHDTARKIRRELYLARKQ